MLREIIKATSEFYNIQIPKEYLNQDIEILVLPFSIDKNIKNNQANNTDVFSKTSGILKSKNIDPLKWQNEMRSDREL